MMKMELVSDEHEENMMALLSEEANRYCELVRFLMEIEDELSTKECCLVSDVSKTFIRVHYGLCNTMESVQDNNDPLYNDLNSVSDIVNEYRSTVETSLSDIIANVTSNDTIKNYVDAFLIRQKNTHVDAFLYPFEYYVQNQDLKLMSRRSVQQKENPNIISKNPETITKKRKWSPGEYESRSGNPESSNDIADNPNIHHVEDFTDSKLMSSHVPQTENPNIISKNPETVTIDRMWSPGEYGSPSGSPKSPNDIADNLNLHHMGDFFLGNEFVLNDRCKNIKQGRQWNGSFKIEDDDDEIFGMGPDDDDDTAGLQTFLQNAVTCKDPPLGPGGIVL